YDRENSKDAIRCLSLDTGEEIWRYTYSVEIKRNHGMSRTVPAVANGYVVSFGPKCHIKCLDAETGELNWERQLVMDNNARVPLWYAGQCPLIDGKNVILAPGADPLMMAIDIETGEIVWEAVDDVITGQTHSSIIPMEIEGVRQYVYEAETGVVGVEAETGRVLWTYPGWKIKIANVASPVYVGGGRIFCSGGYGAGSAMLQIEKDESGQFTTQELFRLPPSVFGSEQHTPIFYDGYLYGVEPRPKAEMVCLNVDGEREWASGGEHRFEIGPYMIVDGRMLALHGQTGELSLAEVSPAGFTPLAKAKVLDGHDVWAPMAYAEGRLIVRDLTQMICLDIGD
ncbi:MAG: PQQ-binding-like beta-propeller repeat protein, partial [Candidatus Sumerlaeota bacterium]